MTDWHVVTIRGIMIHVMTHVIVEMTPWGHDTCDDSWYCGTCDDSWDCGTCDDSRESRWDCDACDDSWDCRNYSYLVVVHVVQVEELGAADAFCSCLGCLLCPGTLLRHPHHCSPESHQCELSYLPAFKHLLLCPAMPCGALLSCLVQHHDTWYVQKHVVIFHNPHSLSMPFTLHRRQICNDCIANCGSTR